jgi:uncharacterized membrane protein YfcA
MKLDTLTASLIVPLIIVLLSLIQSVVGVGLLIFGTPCFLLLGYSFTETLSLLLPCSIVISALQTAQAWHRTEVIRREFFFFGVPGVLGGLLCTLSFTQPIAIRTQIGALLILSGLLRSTPELNQRVHSFLNRLFRPSLLLIGILHGATNMGGGLLTVLFSKPNSEKKTIRENISVGYLLFGLAQLGALIAAQQFTLQLQQLLYPLLAGLTFIFAGQRIFQKTTEVAYARLLTGLILAFGTVLILNR